MPLSVIGAGLGRTGTLSLKAAIDQLGFGPCFHDPVSSTSVHLWRARSSRSLDWDAILSGYRAAVDLPICFFYRELSEKYPSAKVILTVREPQAWFESTQQTIFAPRTMADMLRLSGEARRYLADMFSTAFGPRLHDSIAVISAYERHNAEVQRSIPAHRLLVYEVRQGWAPLCAFLEVPVPDAPFPALNSRQEFRTRLNI